MGTTFWNDQLLGMLTPNEIAVLVVLDSFPTSLLLQKDISYRAGMAVTTLRRTLKSLKARGLVDWAVPHSNSGGAYYFIPVVKA
jgi:DNA-binding MarR family transcriptional regulator